VCVCVRVCVCLCVCVKLLRIQLQHLLLLHYCLWTPEDIFAGSQV